MSLAAAFAAGVAITSCSNTSEDAEVRIAWRPDSLLIPTQADSCIQRYYLRGNRLGSFVWCPPYAKEYLKSEEAIEVILSRGEQAKVTALADAVASDRPALGQGIFTLRAGEALVWRRHGTTRRGFRVRLPGDPAAQLLHQEMIATLSARRRSAQQ